MAISNTRIILDLHTDFQNIKTYSDQGNIALVRELVMVAEAKLHQIAASLSEAREECGLQGCAKIITVQLAA